MRHKFLLVTVKEWLKSVLNYRSYLKNKTGYPFFWTTLYSIHTTVDGDTRETFCSKLLLQLSLQSIAQRTQLTFFIFTT